MRVLVAGATGVLGRRIVSRLASSGHEVIGLCRNTRGSEVVRAAGGKPSLASLFNVDELTNAARGAQTIVHVATAIPKKRRPSNSDWVTNDRVRVDGARALIETARRVGAEHLILQSIVWVARPADQSKFDEDSPTNPDLVTRSAIEAEHLTLDAGKHSVTTTVLRCGQFYGPDDWHTRSLGDALRNRKLPVIGSGEALWSLLHVDDAARAFCFATERRPAGIFHVVDDEPVQVGAFLRYFANRLGARPPFRIPVWMGRILAGPDATRFVTTSTFTDASRFRNATGWTPTYPTFREGLDQVTGSWAIQDSDDAS